MADACSQRIARFIDRERFSIFQGDCNSMIDDIIAAIPEKALTIAFVDPTGLDIQFETMRTLAGAGRVDVLVSLMDALDFVRNVESYAAVNESKADAFFGHNAAWRKHWADAGDVSGPEGRKFLTNLYKEQLKTLGYVAFGEKPITGPQGRPLYRLFYASKHPRGLDFWNKVTKKDRYGQRDLF